MSGRADLKGAASTRRRKALIARLPATCCICFGPIDTSLSGNHPLGAIQEHIIPASRAPHLALDVNNKGLAHRVCGLRRSTKPLGQAQRAAKARAQPQSYSRRWV